MTISTPGAGAKPRRAVTRGSSAPPRGTPGLVRSLAGACHPAPTVVVTVCATLLAYAAGHTAPRIALIGAAVLAGQLSIGWSNDWFDAARDRSVGRTDKPVAAGAVPVRTVATAACLAAVAATVLSLWVGLIAGLLHLIGVASGWLYNWPLKTTVASPLPYLVGFGVLPSFVVVALPGGPTPPWWLPTAAAMLGAGAHFANVLPDLSDDLRTGVRGLPHRLGAVTSYRVTVVLLLGAGIVLVSGRGTDSIVAWLALAVAALTLIGAALLRRRYGERLLFHAVLGVALVDVGLLLTAPL
ncbi:MAG: UbiA family prenyltransferase [Micromonosporaceae bacterium]